ncbi:oxidoreductase [Apiospora rasikravindrae]|uniref:Oxidoreductase n=1 Tax=Apiospora rasikravindrae TaxID=990691 RepID=A0ABR1TDG1_9PEZI
MKGNYTATCCASLQAIFGNKTILPSTPAYQSSLTSYFSAQAAAIHPACIVAPESAADVASAVQLLTGESSCLQDEIDGNYRPFAVRSGGHATQADAANIDGGVTIDLRRLNSIEVSPDRSTVAIGAGNTWDHVYSHLDPANLCVNGGRTADVGVGGLVINSVDAYDEYAALTLTWGYSPEVGAIVSSNMEYTKETENPPVFAGLAGLPKLFGESQMSNMTQLAIDLRNQQVRGQRQFWATHTFASTEAALNVTHSHFHDEFLPTIQSVPDIVVGYTMEPLPPALYAKHTDQNVLGLDNRSGSLVISLLTVSWTESTDDERVQNAGRALIEAIDKGLKEIGAHDPFVYLNYAAPWQDPIASYGPGNVEKLRKVADEVDPHEVFARQVPGGFKIQR